MPRIYEDMDDDEIRACAAASTEKLLRKLRTHHAPLTLRAVRILSEKAKICSSENDLRVEEVERIKEGVCEFFSIKRDDLMGDQRRFSWPRQIAMYLVHEDLKISFPQTARRFRRVDHTTALFAHRKVKRALSEPGAAAGEVSSIRALVGAI